MKWVLRIVAGIAGLIVLAVLALFLAGFRKGHGWCSASVEIAQPPDRVWTYLTDDQLVMKWVSGLHVVKHLNDTSGVGARMYMVERYKDQDTPMEMEVTGFEPNRAIRFNLHSVGDPSNGFEESGGYLLEPTSTGTKLTLSATSIYHGFVVRLLEPLITPEAQKKVTEDLNRLAALAEGRTR
jgi:uncharacterized protein YndB with AHSA1/START domain